MKNAYFIIFGVIGIVLVVILHRTWESKLYTKEDALRDVQAVSTVLAALNPARSLPTISYKHESFDVQLEGCELFDRETPGGDVIAATEWSEFSYVIKVVAQENGAGVSCMAKAKGPFGVIYDGPVRYTDTPGSIETLVMFVSVGKVCRLSTTLEWEVLGHKVTSSGNRTVQNLLEKGRQPLANAISNLYHHEFKNQPIDEMICARLSKVAKMSGW